MIAPEGSVGEKSCVSKRACDHNDLDIKHSKCEDGKRTVSYKWSDVDKDGKPDCNPKHNASTV